MLLYRLEHCFPSAYDGLSATSLGNSIAAFEDYPRIRYGIDSIALWPRLLPILRDEKYHEYVAQEKMTFDFLLNMLAVTTILGFEFIYFFLYIGNVALSCFALGLTTFLLWVLYSGAGGCGATVGHNRAGGI